MMTNIVSSKSLLVATTALVAVAASPFANAATYTISGTPDTVAKTITGTDDLTVPDANDLTVAAADAVTVDASSTGATVDTAGDALITTTTSGVGVNVVSGATGTTITTTGTGGITGADQAILLNGTATTVDINSGTTVTAGSGKSVIDVNASTTILDIDGAVTATGTGTALDIGGAITNNINITANGVVSAASGGTVISVGDVAITNGIDIAGAVTAASATDAAINNSSNSNATAIDLTGTGTITGTIQLGTGGDTITNAGTGAITGAVTGGTGADTIVLSSSGDIVGNVDLGAGNNTVTLSGAGGNISGTLTTGAGTDTLTVSNTGTISGAVDLGAGNDTVNLSGTGGLGGALTLGTGDDTITASAAATIAGAVDGGTGTDTITQSTGVLTLGGAVTNVETITTSGTGGLTTGADVTGAAITHGGSGTITVGSGTTVSGATTAVTVSDGGGAISVAGTLTGSTTAIDASANTTARTYSAADGTINGNILLGTGGDTVALTGSTASTITGNITGGAGADTVQIANSTANTITGNIDLAGGADTLDIDEDFSTAGTIAGTEAIDVASGKTFTVNNAVSGVTTTTVNSATLKIASGGSIDGNIAGASGSNTLDIDTDFTAAGTIADVETIDVAASTTFTTGGDVTGLDTALTLGADSTLDLNHDMNSVSTATITSAGTMTIASNKTLAGASLAQTGRTLTFEDDGTNGPGQISLTGAATLTNNSTDLVSIEIVPTGDKLTTGNKTLITTGSGVTGTLDTHWEILDNSFVYSFTDASAGNDLIVAVARENTMDTIGGSNTNNMGTVLEAVRNTATGELQSAMTAIETSGSTEAAAEAAMKTLLPSVEGGAVQASTAAAGQAFSTVENRLASLRASGVATGDEMAMEKAVWGQVFGTSANQDDRGGVSGYDVATYGLAFGGDTELAGGKRIGVSVSYANSNVDGVSSETDVNSYQATVYGSQDFGNYYVDGLVGVAYNNYDGERTVTGVSSKANADYDGMQYTAKVAGGYKLATTNGFNVTPTASLQYTYLQLDDYTETGAGTANLSVDNEAYDNLKATLGATVAYPVETESMSFVPEVRAAVAYDVIQDEQSATSTFTGGGAAFKTEGIDAPRVGLNLGAGIGFDMDENLSIRVDYDAELKSDYSSHNGLIKARYTF